jgi:hypothetical protein
MIPILNLFNFLGKSTGHSNYMNPHDFYFLKNMELPLMKFYEHKALTSKAYNLKKIITKSYESYKVIKMTSSFC